MKNTKILLLISLLFLFSCKNENKTTNIITKNVNIDTSNLKNIIINLEKSTDVSISQLIKPQKYVRLQTNDINLIGRIQRIIIRNKVIYLLDSEVTRTIYVFNIDGDFMYKIQSRGRGPNELINITDFAINESQDTIFAVNGINRQIASYSASSGKIIYKNRMRLSANNIGVDEDNNLWISNSPYELYGNNKEYAFKLFKYNYHDTTIKGYYGTDNVLDQLLCIPTSPLDLYYNGDELNFIDQYRYQIMTLNNSGFKLKYHFNFLDYSISSSQKDINCQNYKEYFKNKAVGFYSFCESGSIIIFSIPINEKYYFCVYDTDKERVMYLQAGIRINLADASKKGIFGFNMPKTTYRNQFVSVLQPFKIKIMVNYLKKNDLWEKVANKYHFIKTLEDVKENDNPILFYFTINK